MVLQTFFKDYEGTNLVSEKTSDDLMEELEDREHLLDCLAHLSENQRQRILMLAQGMSITEIARVQHADRTTVRESIQAARKIFLKTPPFSPLFSVNSERSATQTSHGP